MHTPAYSFKKNVRKEKKLVPVKSFKSDALTIGPKFNLEKTDRLEDNPTKSIKKARTNDRMRKVEYIRDPSETSRELTLRLLRIKLDQWLTRVSTLYEDGWKGLSEIDSVSAKELVAIAEKMEEADVEIIVVLLSFEENGWSDTYFRKEPSGYFPEWMFRLKLLIDNMGSIDALLPGKRITPNDLQNYLKTFIQTTMLRLKKEKYDEKTLLEMIRMLTVIADGFYYTPDRNADDTFDSFKTLN